MEDFMCTLEVIEMTIQITSLTKSTSFLMKVYRTFWTKMTFHCANFVVQDGSTRASLPESAARFRSTRIFFKRLTVRSWAFSHPSFWSRAYLRLCMSEGE